MMMSYEPIAVALANVAIRSVVPAKHRNFVVTLPSKAFCGPSRGGYDEHEVLAVVPLIALPVESFIVSSENAVAKLSPKF